jgi:hypothetical protein
MRHVATVLIVLLGWMVPAQAQPAREKCHPISPTERVVVTAADGRTLRGSLLCLGERDLLLAADGVVTRHPLSDVRRVVTRADPVWDGAAKGAAIPLVVWAVLCRQCDSGTLLRATATYGLIGLAFDAIDSNRRTVYAGRPAAPTLAWRVRF